MLLFLVFIKLISNPVYRLILKTKLLEELNLVATFQRFIAASLEG